MVFSNSVSVLLADGDGGFHPPTNFATGSRPLFVLVHDFDDQGALDLVLADSESDDVTILLNRCRPCPADLDGSGGVDRGDLFAILAAWGPCEDCPEDLDGSGVVDFGDVLIVLASWGPCQ